MMFLTVVFFFFNTSALFNRSGKLLFGLVKKICLPDRMSGKNLNTFANTDIFSSSNEGQNPNLANS